ncbi:MAG: hypothetical protein E6R03_05600 [Hyphomicrobiaceae bacterium]|nr:MAG: hypothetical protein E6R03_05600 [Hyphomicrobiaceae bacterium]
MPVIPDPLDKRNKVAIEEAKPLYDRINKVWEKAEESFRKKGILAPVEYAYTDDDSGSYSIGLQKFSGKWRICIGYFHYSDPEQSTNWSLMTDAPIEDRVHCLQYLKNLYEALVKTNEELVPKLRKAAEDAEEVLRKLGI